MKRSLSFILFFLYPLFTSIALYPLLAITPIKTVNQGLKAVEDLQASELVISFDFDQKNFSQSAIQVISSSVEPYALIIHTDQADFCCSPKQLFYDYQTESFIPAFKLDSSSILISKDGNLYQCIEIEIKEGWTTFYEIHLKKPHTFFRTTITKQIIVKRVDDAFFERTLNTLRIGIHALFNMARKNIASSLIQYVLHHGKTLQAYYPDRCIIIDYEHKIAVVQEKPSLKILNVGFLAHDMPQLNPPAPKNIPPKESDENKKKEADNANSEQDEHIKTVEDILKDTKPIKKKKKSKSQQFEKPGGFEEAQKDFESLCVKDIKKHGAMSIGVLPNGAKVIVRPNSSFDNLPTLEIQLPGNQKKIKIRYN